MQGARFLSSQVPRISILRTNILFLLGGRLVVGNKRPLVVYTAISYIIGDGRRGTGGFYDDIRITNTQSVYYVQISRDKVLRIVNQLSVSWRGVSCYCIVRYLLLKNLGAPSETN